MPLNAPKKSPIMLLLREKNAVTLLLCSQKNNNCAEILAIVIDISLNSVHPLLLAGPYPTITPGAFNLVGSPYTDRMGEHRAGGDHIVPGGAFGVGNIECSLSTLVRGKLFSLSECMEDGTVYAKVFGPDDINCSGELYNEVLMFPRAAQTDMTGGMCALGIFEDGRREYYR